MKNFNGFIDSALITKFKTSLPENMTYQQYASFFLDLERFIACAALLSPDFVEINGSVFLSGNLNLNKDDPLNNRFGSDRKTLEIYNNIFCINEFFLNETTHENNFLLRMEMGKILIHFWSIRLKELFFNRKFEFLLQENLMDEDGVCISFYEIV